MNKHYPNQKIIDLRKVRHFHWCRVTELSDIFKYIDGENQYNGWLYHCGVLSLAVPIIYFNHTAASESWQVKEEKEWSENTQPEKKGDWGWAERGENWIKSKGCMKTRLYLELSEAMERIHFHIHQCSLDFCLTTKKEAFHYNIITISTCAFKCKTTTWCTW